MAPPTGTKRTAAGQIRMRLESRRSRIKKQMRWSKHLMNLSWGVLFMRQPCITTGLFCTLCWWVNRTIAFTFNNLYFFSYSMLRSPSVLWFSNRNHNPSSDAPAKYGACAERIRRDRLWIVLVTAGGAHISTPFLLNYSCQPFTSYDPGLICGNQGLQHATGR